MPAFGNRAPIHSGDSRRGNTAETGGGGRNAGVMLVRFRTGFVRRGKSPILRNYIISYELARTTRSKPGEGQSENKCNYYTLDGAFMSVITGDFAEKG